MIEPDSLSKTATGYFDEKLSEIYILYQNALSNNNGSPWSRKSDDDYCLDSLVNMGNSLFI